MGTASIFIGVWCGAMIAFLIARYICRDFVEKYFKKRPIFRAMDKLMEQEGLKFIILARLSVIVPFNVSNYVLGSTSVSYGDFATGTLYILPMCSFMVYIGTTASTI